MCIKISTTQFLDAKVAYLTALAELPINVRAQFPDFEDWLCGDGYGWAMGGMNPEAYNRYRLISGPYPTTVLRAWAIKHGISESWKHFLD